MTEMAIRFLQGNILEADAVALVNPVNCIGVMGKGLAAGFKKAFPGNFLAYREACSKGELKLGRVYAFTQGDEPVRLIINFPTKDHWRDKSRIWNIRSGLSDLRRVVLGNSDIRSIAIPALGCGLGGLEWSVVRPRIVQYMSDIAGVDVQVFEPRPAKGARS